MKPHVVRGENSPQRRLSRSWRCTFLPAPSHRSPSPFLFGFIIILQSSLIQSTPRAYVRHLNFWFSEQLFNWVHYSVSLLHDSFCQFCLPNLPLGIIQYGYSSGFCGYPKEEFTYHFHLSKIPSPFHFKSHFIVTLKKKGKKSRGRRILKIIFFLNIVKSVSI